LRGHILRELARTDVYAYGEHVFGYRPAIHHREMVDFMDACVRDGINGVVLEPRGHAKTTWGNTIWLSHYIAEHPDVRIGLISNTARQSADFSRAIRWTFENNTNFRDIYGDCVSQMKWTDVEWLHKASAHHGSKDVTLYAQGVGGAIISKRFDIVICDDILDDENTMNIENQEKTEQWFWKTLKPCLTSKGIIIVLGTRWAEGDLYGRLIAPPEEGGRGWRHLIRSALVEVDGEPRALWPEEWSVDLLQAEREAMGPALFACAYQNDITGLMAGNVFQGSFQYFTQLDPEKHYTIRMGVDLASSEKERADYTARVITAEDEDGNFYVLSVYRDKRETHHEEFVVDGYQAYPDMALVIIENQQFQSTLIQRLMQDYPRIPVEGRKSDVDKTSRARAVSAKYEAHKVFHHASLKDSVFEVELRSFPKGHDDMVDALGFSMDLRGSGFFFGKLGGPRRREAYASGVSRWGAVGS
jgi:predicted phage terminase large subunit-like protein